MKAWRCALRRKHYEAKPAVTKPGLRSGCVTCGPQPVTFPMGGIIAIGFGDALVTRCGEAVIDGERYANAHDGAKFRRGRSAEAVARMEPGHDWRIVINGPLSRAVYQRQAARRWVLIETGMGFA